MSCQLEGIRITSVTIYIPQSFSAEEFEFWVRSRKELLGRLGAVLFEPAEVIDWLVNEERSLSE